MFFDLRRFINIHGVNLVMLTFWKFFNLRCVKLVILARNDGRRWDICIFTTCFCPYILALDGDTVAGDCFDCAACFDHGPVRVSKTQHGSRTRYVVSGNLASTKFWYKNLKMLRETLRTSFSPLDIKSMRY